MLFYEVYGIFKCNLKHLKGTLSRADLHNTAHSQRCYQPLFMLATIKDLQQWPGPAQQVFEWGGLEKQTGKMNQLGVYGGMLPRKMLILTPLKYREMHLKLIN